MLRTEGSVVINAPAADVFAFLTHIGSRPLLMSTLHEETLTTSGPLRAGSQFTQRLDLFGRVVYATLEVTVCTPPRHFAYQTTVAPYPFVINHHLVPTGPITQLSVVLEGEPGTYFGIVGPTLELLFKHHLHNDLETIKGFLEVSATRHTRSKAPARRQPVIEARAPIA